MAQDFWIASGFGLLARRPEGLVVTDAWLGHLLEREEMQPPAGASPRERELHAFATASPRAPIEPRRIDALEDADAASNWRELLRFRDHVIGFPTLEDAYAALFKADAVPVAPPFVDLLAELIVRAILDGTDDARLCRAGEIFFREQRVSTEGGQVLAADRATIEMFAANGGFGSVGKLLRGQGAELAPVKMDILNRENAPFYFLRDALHSFALDLTPGREGAAALAEVLTRWIARLLGVEVAIAPVERIDDARWRWHVGLDAEATRMLNALYDGAAVDATELERMIALYRLEFRDARDVIPEMADRAVYLGFACRADRTLRMKPQNLLANLPLRSSPARRGRGTSRHGT
jgi:hypothetical protein